MPEAHSMTSNLLEVLRKPLAEIERTAWFEDCDAEIAKLRQEFVRTIAEIERSRKKRAELN
jgi:hypothetical protein